jgi:RimJ/RimL family protein N-acetyltransferase
MTAETTARYAVRPVDAARDAAVLHSWVVQDRAAFWGMADCTEERVEEIYAWMAEQTHLEALLVLVDEAPVGVLQTYDPFVDEIGGFYDRREGDLGVHLLLSDAPPRRGHTGDLVGFLIGGLLARPGVQRLVLEPDARNERSCAMAERLGAERGPRVRLRTAVADKPAQFYFLTRDRWSAATS